MEFVAPHTKKAKPVTSEDLPRIIMDGIGMLDLCWNDKNGNRMPHPVAYAIAHPQVEEKKPLAFFVLNDGAIICNPKIIRHVNYEVDSKEGCMTFIGLPQVPTKRWHKIEVEQQRVRVGDDEVAFLGDVEIVSVSGKLAHVYQHEIDHFDGKYVYDNTIVKLFKKALKKRKQ